MPRRGSARLVWDFVPTSRRPDEIWQRGEHNGPDERGGDGESPGAGGWTVSRHGAAKHGTGRQQGHSRRQSRSRSGDPLRHERERDHQHPHRDQRELDRPADQRAAREHGMAPGGDVRPPRRDRGAVPAQGPAGLHRRPDPDPEVAGTGWTGPLHDRDRRERYADAGRARGRRRGRLEPRLRAPGPVWRGRAGARPECPAAVRRERPRHRRRHPVLDVVRPASGRDQARPRRVPRYPHRRHCTFSTVPLGPNPIWTSMTSNSCRPNAHRARPSHSRARFTSGIRPR